MRNETAPVNDHVPTAERAPAAVAPATPRATPLTLASQVQSSSNPAPPPSRLRSSTAACYVDFENLLFSAVQHRHSLSIPRIVRHLNRLGREATGIGWSVNAVYANWDAIITHHRHAQDDWTLLGWRTVAVAAREDYLSTQPVKNLVDFVMSLDMLEDARDRGWEHFVIVSGDADFCEVAERLKRLRRRVTVVALKPNLSYRLSEAADDFIVWGWDDVTGDEPMPLSSYRRLSTAAGPREHAKDEHGEDAYQVLVRAVRQAERDQGGGAVSWRVIRDEYFLRMTRMSEADADRFVRELDRAGFVTVVARRGRDGARHVYLSIPH